MIRLVYFEVAFYVHTAVFIFKQKIFQIDLDKFVNTIERLNTFYAEAEKVGASTYCEGCFACLTGYLLYLCMETHYQKVNCHSNEYTCSNSCVC